MDYAINDLEQEILNLTRAFAQQKLKPMRAQLDEREEFSKEVYEQFVKAGLFGLWLPEKYGGRGGGITCLAMAFEELSRVCAGLALTTGTSALGAIPMFLAATPQQRERWCYDLASGKKLWAFALTEPEAGSDATALKTTALKDCDYYVVNGTKHFISTGKEADFYTVAVNTNPSRGARGISLLVIEKDTPGFSFGKKEHKLGIRTNPTYELIFDNVRVPKENLLGSEGRGLLYVQETLDFSRPGVAAQAVGIAQGALDETIPYLRTRKQFGQPIIMFQALAHKVAELAAKTEAGRAMEVADECVTLCGGVGYMRDFPVEKYMRDAKVTQIYEGTVHIQKNEIVAALMKEYAAAAPACPSGQTPAQPTVSPEELLRGYCKKKAQPAGAENAADLSHAQVVVAGGRGVGNKEGFALLQKLADRLGGTVAGTRPAADSGWISPDLQIGITGKTVRPKLYIACGISGQSHHLAGVHADVIVAINKDPNAPIMKLAQYPIVGDLYEVLPQLLKELN